MGDLTTVHREPTEEERSKFALEDGTAVVELSRVIATESRPVAYLIDVVPQVYIPIQTRGTQFQGSVLDLMLERKHPAISHAHSEVHALSASAQVARALQIQRGDVLLCLEGWLYSKEGTVIDHTYSYFLPGTFRFHVLRRPIEI
jgi:GntR family transcriptional regulator